MEPSEGQKNRLQEMANEIHINKAKFSRFEAQGTVEFMVFVTENGRELFIMANNDPYDGGFFSHFYR